MLGAELIRLQCYEGIDAGQALYEWDYSRQLLYARLLAVGRRSTPTRPSTSSTGRGSCASARCCAAVRAGSRAVLLVDELDRADDEFEAFLLEALSDSAVTIPEIGSIGSPDGSRRPS